MPDLPWPSPDLLRVQVAWALQNEYAPRLFWGSFPLSVPSLWLVLAGDAQVEGAGSSVEVKAGQWLWFPPCEARRITVGTAGMNWLSVGLSVRVGQRTLGPTEPRVWNPDAEEAARGEFFMRELIGATLAGKVWERDGLAQTLTGWLWRIAPGNQHEMEFPDWLQTALEQIERDPEVSVAALSAQAHFSPAQFRRLWQHHLGQSPQQTLLSRRLERARAALERGELSLSAVAQSSGFTSTQTLTRAFKTEFGLAPLAWRRTVRQAK